MFWPDFVKNWRNFENIIENFNVFKKKLKFFKNFNKF